jgi:L-alanine-DL-glutamate epimerase-like enolase superfamily enzyme
MSVIERIDVTHHRLPLDPPFVASWDGRPRRHFDVTVVRVTDDAGRVGIGSGDLMLGLKGHEDLFVGQDPRRLERHYEVLSHIQFHYGRCWPLDLALWDLTGKVTGEPVWRLLGGRSDRVRAYASSGVLRDPGALAETAERFADAGFAAMKVRFHRGHRGGDWRDDIAALETVRERVGTRLELMVDCNQGWRMPWDTEAPWTLKDALAVARELERLDVYWMEEPLHRADREGLKRLRDSVDLRVAGGEMTRELHEFRDLIAGGCLDVVQPDCALVGGITGLRRVAVMAREFGVAFTPHTWSNGFGVVANTHLTCGLGEAAFIEFPCDPPEWSLDRRDYLLSVPFDHTEGWLKLTEAPGFGVELDEDRLAATKIA